MTTKLDIINAMLRATGERKHNTLVTQHPSVLSAIDLFDRNDVEFQARGWWFNREHALKLIPADDNTIIIPDNHLSFSISRDHLNASTSRGKTRYVVRNNKLYDTYEHTYEIKTSVYADMIIKLEVEELPALAATYLLHKCVEDFVTDDDGDMQKVRKYEERRMTAFLNLKVEELRTTGVNSFDRPAIQQMNYRLGGVGSNPRWPGGIR